MEKNKKGHLVMIQCRIMDCVITMFGLDVTTVNRKFMPAEVKPLVKDAKREYMHFVSGTAVL